jgi:arginyl-tRNA synthetase
LSEKRSDNAVQVRIENPILAQSKKLDMKYIVQKADGTTLYITRYDAFDSIPE